MVSKFLVLVKVALAHSDGTRILKRDVQEIVEEALIATADGPQSQHYLVSSAKVKRVDLE